MLELPVRPTAIEELQAASAVGQGRLYRTYDELLRERGIQSAQVLLTFFDMSARTHYVNARRTLRKLLDWRIVPVINENDTTTTDEISFGDNDFLAAQVAVLVGRRAARAADRHRRASTPPTRARTRGARSSRGRPTSRRSPTLDIGHADVAARLGRDALEGRRGRDGDARRASRTVIAIGLEPGVLAARLGGRAGGHALRAPARAPLELQAVAQVRQAHARHGDGRRGRRAGAARRRHVSLLPVGIVDVRGALRRGRRRRGRAASDGARSARGSATTRRSSCAG